MGRGTGAYEVRVQPFLVTPGSSRLQHGGEAGERWFVALRSAIAYGGTVNY